MVGSSLTFAETANNLDFLAAHPGRFIQLTSFDAALGMESYISVNLSMLGMSWDILPATCVLGTGGSCRYQFNELTLFSLPELVLITIGPTGTDAQLTLQVTDGTANAFDAGSVQWEAFPSGATLQAGSCTRAGAVTTCTATLTFGAEDAYTVFVSGQGILGTVGGQFKEIPVSKDACGSPVLWQGREWQRCGSQGSMAWHGAIAYCENLVEGGHDDWRLPIIEDVCAEGSELVLWFFGVDFEIFFWGVVSSALFTKFCSNIDCA